MSTTAAPTTKGRPTTVYVLKHEAEFIVRPAQVGVVGGTEVRFVNVTDGEITVFLPDVFNVPAITIEARHCSRDVPVPLLTTPTAFAYSVFAAEGQTLCRGESSPIIIVEK